MTGGLPVNVKFMFEGEEEIGSPSLDAFIREHNELLAADVVLSADGAMWRIDEPSLTVASRGLGGARVDAHGGRRRICTPAVTAAPSPTRCTRWRD